MIRAADLFCGAGGTSTGLKQACDQLGLKLDLTAINHWDLAIETHTKNHPYTNHLCMNLDSIEPRKVFPEGLDILLASPECTHHSIARGGKPKSDQSRASAFRVTDWAEALRPKFILVENVREFMDWGPLDDEGKPIKKLKGKTFLSWINTLEEGLGYKVKYEVLNCANYGDPTTRRRFFLLASRMGKVDFPEPTHLQPGQMKFEGQKDWIPAKEIIDWSVPGKSIFKRKKRLADKTLDRIWKGMEKFCKEEFKPFLTMMYGNSDSTSLDNPLPTVLASGGNHYLAEPFLVETSFPGERAAEDIEKPLSTQTARQSKAVVTCEILDEDWLEKREGREVAKEYYEKFIKPFENCEDGDEVAEPFLVKLRGTSNVADIEKPAPTITAGGNHLALAEPFLVNISHSKAKPAGMVRSTENPMPTQTTAEEFALCNPKAFLLGQQSCAAPRGIDQPIPTVATAGAISIVEPFIVKFYGTAHSASIDNPLPTITTTDRFGLVRTYGIDIHFRMLKPHELAAAMSFPDDYEFAGNQRDKVKQIGNAVPVSTAKALCSEILKAALVRVAV